MKRILPVLLAAAALAPADTIVLRDRTILTGPVERANDALVLSGRRIPLAEVLLWEDDRGRALHTPGLEAHLDGCAAIGRRDLLAACRARFPEALATGATDSARSILEQAALAGLPAKEAAEWEANLLRTEKKEGATVAAPGADLVAALLVQRASASIDAGEEYRGWQLLRAALRRDRESRPALDLLDAIAPENFRIGQYAEKGKDPYAAQRLWLDWEVDVLRGEVRAIGRLHPDMDRARTTWRKELNGLETREEGAEIVFVTPINDRTEVLGKCVRYAKITCRALARMFATETPKRDDNMPLVIYFYESRDEYLKDAGPGNPFLAMTAGFYTPGENISRFFWPDRVDATTAVRDTFVHELTHHWIERRNPRWHESELAGQEVRVNVPGYWVVEGFATFIEEGRYDIETYAWSHFSPRANSLNVVAALAAEKEKKLIDWEKVYTLSQSAFHGAGLGKEGIFATAKKRWAITPVPFVEIRLFYEQSAATCHYLYWAENGKHRAALLDYVTAFYTSQRAKTDVQAAFGLAPRELGKRVEEFARKVVDGWRPPAK